LKSKISKIMGMGLTFVLLVSLMVFALPASADPGENEWSKFAYPAPAWFNDPGITAVGPMAQAIDDGPLYAYVEHGANDIFKSVDGGRTWTVSAVPDYYIGGPVVDMVCSELSEDIIYVTDGNYVYKSITGGTTFNFVAKADLEKNLMGACGIDIIDLPITSIDVAYDGANKPVVFIGTKLHDGTVGSVYWIADESFPASWTDLELSCYGVGWDVYAVGCAPDFATSNKTYVVVSRMIASLGDNAEWAINEAAPRGYSAKLDFVDAHVYVDIAPAAGYTGLDFSTAAATDFGFWYYQTAEAGFGPQLELKFEEPLGGPGYVEITLMLQGNTTLDAWTWVDLGSTFGGIVTWDGAPGTLQDLAAAQALMDTTYPTYELTRVRVELYDDPAPSRTCYIDDVTINGETYDLPGETHVVYTTGTVCSWTPVAELVWNCDAANNFAITHASRIAFPSYYGTSPTLFVGVVGVDVGVDNDGGGDVYSVTASSAIDLNVVPGGGCSGVDTNICSLDILNDALIAGAYGATDVYYSADNGWNWTASKKDPTGLGQTYVLFAGDSVLAATAGTECAVSLSCGEDIGKFWNQISLIDTDIDAVLDISHAPGYLTGTSPIFIATKCEAPPSYSLFRYDQTNWERVFSTTALMDWVEVSPDFNKTGCVYLANTGFEMFRSMDQGCSWTALTYPCFADRVPISAWIVVDEETVLAAGGAGTIYKTTKYGTRPWDAFPVTGAGDGIDFDLSPNIANDSSVLLGDDHGGVFLSTDLGATWTTTPAGAVTGTLDTYVQFDPGYGTSGDPGENIFYAAASTVIARYDVSVVVAGVVPFETIGSVGEASGIAAAGDTALYVADATAVDVETGGVWRSLNPLAPAALVEFEQLTLGLVADEELVHPSFSDDLWLTAGSNMLWALDSIFPTTIWMWEDPLATPVISLTPTDGAKIGTTGAVTLTWEALDGASLYEISLYRYCPQCPDEMLPVYVSDTDDNYTSADTCLIVTGLDAGTKYYWKVRVAKEKPFYSKWSELRTFDTALGPVLNLCSPSCGASDVILTTNFSWEAVPGATGYEVEIATNEDFDPVIASGTAKVNAWAAAPELDYSTTYYWQVRAVKDGVVGAWSVCLFTTMDEPAEPIAPVSPVVIPPVEEITPTWIWVIIGIGGALVIAVIILIVNTRRVP